MYSKKICELKNGGSHKHALIPKVGTGSSLLGAKLMILSARGNEGSWDTD